MKKILYILAAATLALSSCTRGSDSDVVGGSTVGTQTLGGRYMMHIADNLMAGALENLELALELGKTEITWASHFTGMTLQKQADKTWQLNYSGPFAFDGQSYPTSFTMTATRLNDEKHADWEVSITGERTERASYSCRFESLGAITYRTTYSNNGWNMLYGRLSMVVYNQQGKKDGCLLQFDGAPSQAKFVRGL